MLLDDFNNTIDKWLTDLQRYDLDKLRTKPDTAGWSMGQLYMHLIEETTWYLEQIEVCFISKVNPALTMKENAKPIFYNNSFPNEIIKGDPFISDHVKQPTDWKTVQADFQKLKEEVNEIWLKIETAESPGKAEHPGLGFFSPVEWFQYAEMHMQHHLKQKERIHNFLSTKTAQ